VKKLKKRRCEGTYEPYKAGSLVIPDQPRKCATAVCPVCHARVVASKRESHVSVHFHGQQSVNAIGIPPFSRWEQVRQTLDTSLAGRLLLRVFHV
jgi:hypothetical protein